MRTQQVMRTAALAILVVLPLSLPLSTAAQSVYRWVDAQGRVHYGDLASAPAGAKPLPQRMPATVASTPAPAPPPPAAETPEACAQLRERLATYESAERIVETDSLGEQRELSAESRERLIALTELEAQRLCDGESERP